MPLENPDSVKAALLSARDKKDSLFFYADDSPLKQEDKIARHGLNYFPLNPDLRFRGIIHVYESPESTVVYGSRENDIRPAFRFGHFLFEYQDQIYRLEVIKILPRKAGTDSFLFLGFTDGTTAKTTYGGGRYIDLQQNDDGTYTVDFNYAYNPYCAYNEKYSCARPPGENHLLFEVSAGEKIYKLH
jgi:hypothetical protein